MIRWDMPILITFWLVIVITLCGAGAQPESLYPECQDVVDTSNSTYLLNLKTLLSEITTQQFHNGFFNLSAGRDPDTVYAIAMCRGDLIASDCHKCLNDITSGLPQNCPDFKGAIGWMNYCMLYYSPNSMFGVEDDGAEYRRCLGCKVQPRGVDVDGYNGAVQDLMGNLTRKAASGNSTLKFAKGKSNYVMRSSTSVTGSNSSNVTIYGLMQCTPDINQTSCNQCLETLAAQIVQACAPCGGAILGAASCRLWYDVTDFLSNVSYPSPTPRPTPSPLRPASSTDINRDNERKPRKHILAIIAVLTVATASLLIFAICFIAYRRKSTRAFDVLAEDVSQFQNAESLQFNLKQIKTATRNFSEDEKLGQGGFGVVYKGRLENGQEVAVKRLLKNSSQGKTEFKTEVVLVARLQHRNLVKLLGFCVSGAEKILVFEYLPNSSLDKFLFDATRRVSLNWETRFRIIYGVAKGLLHLHQDSHLKIIHRDLKSSNILLDSAMNPKIADFGLARLLGVDQNEDETNRIVGTYGYMAPEYAMTGHFSEKTDVYSFGIIVLEIVSGQKNRLVNQSPLEETLFFRAWNFWNEGALLELVDSFLDRHSYPDEEVIKCIHIGLLCIQNNASKRPNMASIVASLRGDSVTFPLPTPPNFLSWSAGSQQVVLASGTLSTTEPENITEIDPR